MRQILTMSSMLKPNMQAAGFAQTENQKTTHSEIV